MGAISAAMSLFLPKLYLCFAVLVGAKILLAVMFKVPGLGKILKFVFGWLLPVVNYFLVIVGVLILLCFLIKSIPRILASIKRRQQRKARSGQITKQYENNGKERDSRYACDRKEREVTSFDET